MCFDFAVRSQHRKVKQSSPLTELTLNDGRPNFIDIMERSNSKQQQHCVEEMAIRSWGDGSKAKAKLKPAPKVHEF